MLKIVDQGVAQNPMMKQVTCKRGCSHCCYKLTLIGIPEGLLIAENIKDKEIPALQEAAERVSEGMIDDGEWFSRQIACPFLKDNECSIYEYRPSCCRYQFSIDDPDKCRSDYDGENIRYIDPGPMQAPIAQFSMDVVDKMHLDRWTSFAPIPVVVLWCLAQLKGDSSIIRGTPLFQWQQEHLAKRKPWLED